MVLGTSHGSLVARSRTAAFAERNLTLPFKSTFKKEPRKEKPSRRKAFPKPACGAAPNKMSQIRISSPGFSGWGLSLCWEGVPTPRDTPQGTEQGLAAPSTASTLDRNSPRAD